MTKWLNRLLLACNVALLAGGVYFIVTRGLGTAQQGQPWQPVELVTIVLAALAALITVLGLFIAVLAIWGYTRISDEARVAASNAARDAAQDIVGKLAPQLVADEFDRRFGGGGDYGQAASEGEASDVNDQPR